MPELLRLRNRYLSCANYCVPPIHRSSGTIIHHPLSGFQFDWHSATSRSRPHCRAPARFSTAFFTNTLPYLAANAPIRRLVSATRAQWVPRWVEVPIPKANGLFYIALELQTQYPTPIARSSAHLISMSSTSSPQIAALRRHSTACFLLVVYPKLSKVSSQESVW